jgi:hypothetical protein
MCTEKGEAEDEEMTPLEDHTLNPKNSNVACKSKG